MNNDHHGYFEEYSFQYSSGRRSRAGYMFVCFGPRIQARCDLYCVKKFSYSILKGILVSVDNNSTEYSNNTQATVIEFIKNVIRNKILAMDYN